jgi:hypothetical protein
MQLAGKAWASSRLDSVGEEGGVSPELLTTQL